MKVGILGAGHVGTCLADLLRRIGFGVVLFDQQERPGVERVTLTPTIAHENALFLGRHKFDALVSCLPYQTTVYAHSLAQELETAFFDLTEDYHTAMEIKNHSRDDLVTVSQCGLAPGFIGLVGRATVEGMKSVENLRLRVGALPQDPRGRLNYSITWSVDGVVNEYFKESSIIRDEQIVKVPSMYGLEKVTLEKNDTGEIGELEAFYTCGGMGLLSEWQKVVKNADYKTLRYPGHAAIIGFLIDDCMMTPEEVKKYMLRACPPTKKDVVIVSALADGYAMGGARAQQDYVNVYMPKTFGAITHPAIAWTTAAGVAATVEMLHYGALPTGFTTGAWVSLRDFVSTEYGGMLWNHELNCD